MKALFQTRHLCRTTSATRFLLVLGPRMANSQGETTPPTSRPQWELLTFEHPGDSIQDHPKPAARINLSGAQGREVVDVEITATTAELPRELFFMKRCKTT